MRITDNQKQKIEDICLRFNHDVSELDILKWLDNFSEGDANKALRVLSFLDYYSFGRIVSCLQSTFQILHQQYLNKKILIWPIGDSGKSGKYVAYYAKKVIDIIDREHFAILQSIDGVDKLSSDYIFVYLDDFAGSGNTFIENRIEAMPANVEECYVTIAYMEQAAHEMEKLNIQIFGDLHKPCFAERGSVFGYPPNMIKMRKFCFSYGNMLYPLDRVKSKRSNIGPFGYKNGQALVAFEYSTPNNTLPIIWANNNNWYPLFPRFINSRIKRFDDFRNNQNYWLSIIYGMGFLPDVFGRMKKYSVAASRMFLLICLIRRKRSRPYICQYLGISDLELTDLMNMAQSYKMVNTHGELTVAAIRLYEEVKARDAILRSHIPPRINNADGNIRIPKSFQGNT